VEACLVGALTKTPEGPVVYNADKCIGCRYCMLACPVGIPRYEWDKTLPYVSKCSMCSERVAVGEAPVCVEACAREAMVFGERDSLLAEAHRRIAKDRNSYLPHVYGEREMGGTSLLYISDVPLDILAWPEKLGDEPMSTLTWPVISRTPHLALGVAGCLTAVTWIIQRRMKLEAEQLAVHSDIPSGEEP
jgi:formate dehydrogenase iron-sulfur subunit